MRNQKHTKTAESIVKEIKRKTRRKFNSEEKIRIIIEGLRGEDSIAAICRLEGINPNLYYRWSKDFLEAGKKRLQGDTTRKANTNEVGKLKKENTDLKELVAELTLENRMIKKTLIRFEIEGPGSIIAVASSNPMSVESYQQPKRKAYKGRCLVIVKSTQESGNIIIKASSTGLQSAQLIITSEEVN